MSENKNKSIVRTRAQSASWGTQVKSAVVTYLLYCQCQLGHASQVSCGDVSTVLSSVNCSLSSAVMSENKNKSIVRTPQSASDMQVKSAVVTYLLYCRLSTAVCRLLS
ncbi:hypothetical protein J6590_075971 [Homalodisca vitripennis]|nr:hypothetical protein J6590_075971 [Homalodisca vitripennis]